MTLHVITGRANAGKSGAIAEKILAALSAGEQPVLVVPGVSDERRAVGEYSDKAPVGVRIAALDRWADGLWLLHGDGRRIVGRATRDALVTRAISESPESSLAAVAATPGFRTLMSELVRSSSGACFTSNTHSATTRGVVAIRARYERLLEAAGLIEPAHARRLLGEKAPVLDGPVVLNRFTELDEAASLLVLGLASCNDVTVALTWEEGFPATRALDELLARLTARAERVDHIPEPADESELRGLSDRLYLDGGLAATGAVRLAVTTGGEAEAAFVAGAVAEAIGQGTAPERIAVAFPDLGAVAPALAPAMAAEGIPFELDRARPVSQSAFGVSVGALVAMALGRGDRTTALGVLMGPHSDLSPEKVAEIDRTWRTKRIDEPRRLLVDIEAAEGRLGQAVASARAVKGTVNGTSANSWNTLIDALLSVHSDKLTAAGDDAAELAASLREDVAAARELKRAIGDMASAEGTPFRAEDVVDAMSALSIGGTSGERPGFVQVTELARLGSRRFDVVVLGGMSAGELSALGDDTLGGELRSALGMKPVPSGEERLRLRFYHAVTRARKRLVCVRRGSKLNGVEVRPSVLWDELVDVYRTPDDEPGVWPLHAPPPETVSAADIAVTAPVFTQGRREARAAITAGVGSGTGKRTIHGALTDTDVVATLALQDTFSATEIESYLSCPYRWFYERVVRPEEIDVEVDARAIGTHAHRLLKGFYDELPTRTGLRRLTAETQADGLELLDTIAGELAPALRASSFAERLDIARAVKWAQATLVDDASLLPRFVPVAHEFGFGSPGESGVELGGVRFRGRIDRIDLSDQAVFVTDYKSSSVVGVDKFEKENRIQAIVYALVASKAFSLPVAGSVYRSLRYRQLRGFWRPDLVGGGLERGREEDIVGEREWVELQEQAAERVARAVEGIRAGRIPRTPADTKGCVFCALRVQCEGVRP